MCDLCCCNLLVRSRYLCCHTNTLKHKGIGVNGEKVHILNTVLHLEKV